MRQIRIPVSTGHEEAGWFGFLYMWQGQPNGAVGTRLQMNDPRKPFSNWLRMEWEDTIGVDALAENHTVPLEQDATAIMGDFYPHLRVVGTTQVKSGRQWIGNSGIVMNKV